jgi:transcriptional coactivator HFI1/ADA1
LTLSTDTASTDIGDFLAVGVDAHVSDILHSLVHLIGHDRPGSNTVKIPAGVHRSDQGSDEEDSDQAIKLDELGDIPKPDLESLRNLFILNPSLHTSTSPAVYKLASGVMLAETEFNEAPSPSSITAEAKSTGSLHNDVKPSARSMGPGMNFEQLERRKQQLVDLELLDLDDAKKVGDEVGKKAKTHKNHWKYEDPALILKSVLG